MSKRPVHAVPHGDGWVNRRAGWDRVAKAFPSEAQSQAAGRNTARREHTEHFIHRNNGTIGERSSYGNDALRPRS